MCLPLKLGPLKSGLFCVNPTNLANEPFAISRVTSFTKIKAVEMEHVREIFWNRSTFRRCS